MQCLCKKLKFSLELKHSIFHSIKFFYTFVETVNFAHRIFFMRNITLNFEAASRPKKNGTYSIYLRVTEDSHHFKQILDVYVHNRKNFNAQAKKETWINGKETYAKLFNAKLAVILESAHKIMVELERRDDLSANNLIIQLKGGKNSNSFLDFIERKIQERLDKRQYSNATTFRYLKQKLESYTNGKDILFKDLTYSFILGFNHYLIKDGSKTKEQLGQITIYGIFCRFKTLYREAVVEEYIINQNNPFDKIKIKKSKSVKIALTKDELEKINDLNLEYNSELWHVRNYFMFSMYMAGIRVGDILDLKWENVENNHLVYVMQKTKSHCSLIIHEKAQQILDLYKKRNSKSTDYIFPIMTMYENEKYKSKKLTEIKKRNRKAGRTSIMNKLLKTIAQKAGITKNLSFHISRHTFANIASQTDIGVYNISQLMRHSSIAMTQNYLNDLNEMARDKCLARVFI